MEVAQFNKVSTRQTITNFMGNSNNLFYMGPVQGGGQESIGNGIGQLGMALMGGNPRLAAQGAYLRAEQEYKRQQALEIAARAGLYNAQTGHVGAQTAGVQSQNDAMANLNNTLAGVISDPGQRQALAAIMQAAHSSNPSEMANAIAQIRGQQMIQSGDENQMRQGLAMTGHMPTDNTALTTADQQANWDAQNQKATDVANIQAGAHVQGAQIGANAHISAANTAALRGANTRGPVIQPAMYDKLDTQLSTIIPQGRAVAPADRYAIIADAVDGAQKNGNFFKSLQDSYAKFTGPDGSAPLQQGGGIGGLFQKPVNPNIKVTAPVMPANPTVNPQTDGTAQLFGAPPQATQPDIAPQTMQGGQAVPLGDGTAPVHPMLIPTAPTQAATMGGLIPTDATPAGAAISPQAAAQPAAQGAKPITDGMARVYLQKAGGDKNAARQMAMQDGFSF